MKKCTRVSYTFLVLNFVEIMAIYQNFTFQLDLMSIVRYIYRPVNEADLEGSVKCNAQSKIVYWNS